MHSIRLRGPWECFLKGETEPRRIEMPATWQALAELAGIASPLRLLRRFGLPTGITPQDRLELVIESAGVSLEVALNRQPLGKIPPSSQPSRFDVTALLAPRNELSLAFSLPPDEEASSPLPCPIGEVRLEIISG